LRSDEIRTSDGEGERVSDEGSEYQQTTQFHYHLELTPAQLKITHTALRSLLDDFGHDEREVLRIIHEVLEKLPDQHAIRAIQLDQEVERQLAGGDGSGEEPPPAAA
jgi:hypothetical protein